MHIENVAVSVEILTGCKDMYDKASFLVNNDVCLWLKLETSWIMSPGGVQLDKRFFLQ